MPANLRRTVLALAAAVLACPVSGAVSHPSAAAQPLTEQRARATLATAWRDRFGAEPDPKRIAEEVRLAFAARRRFAWGAEIPDALFLEDVLPPVELAEPDDPWRAGYFERFAPLVAGVADPGAAAVALNDGIWKPLGIGYGEAPKGSPMVSPERAVALGEVNCTGLAITLADACRALAIPARVAGIPAWSGRGPDGKPVRGYHQWVEVWDGHSWRFLSAIDRSGLDATWFAARAAATEVSDPRHRIYAARFFVAGGGFPLPWRSAVRIPGIDVTPFYTHRRRVRIELPGDRRVELNWQGELVAAGRGPSFEASLAADERYGWTLYDVGGRLIASGQTELGDAPAPRLRFDADQARDSAIK